MTLTKALSLKAHLQGLVWTIKVKPSSAFNDVRYQEGFVVYLKAPPVEGKANALLIKFLAKFFSLTQQQISVLKGQSGRYKSILLKTTLNQKTQIMHQLQSFLPQGESDEVG